MDFPGVVGQRKLQQQLIEMVGHNRLGHAVLFAGRPGTGTLPLAMAFGQYIVSLTSDKPSAPASSPDLFGLPTIPEPVENEGFRWDQQAMQLQHPDLHFSYPVIRRDSSKPALSTDYAAEWRAFFIQSPYGSLYDWLQLIKAENKQGNISVDECADILRKLSLKSFKGGYKVLVMWMPELLGIAGNKLLKLIEEPPPDTILLLAAENENDVLGTIVSRCQLIRVPPIAVDDIANALAEKTGKPLEELVGVARMSHGDFTEALYLLDHADHDWNQTLKNWLNAALVRGSKASAAFAMQNEFVTGVSALGREKQKQLLRYFLDLIEASLRLRVLPDMDHPLPKDELEFAAKLNTIAGISQQKAIAEEIEKAIYFIERNANGKMLFHALTLKIRAIVLEKVKLELS